MASTANPALAQLIDSVRPIVTMERDGLVVVALELYDTPTTARKVWSRVIEGTVRAHLDHRRMVAAGGVPAPKHRYPDRHALERMLRRVKAAQTDTLESPAVGEGTDLRFETDRITGAALVRDGRVVHAEVHRVD